MRSRFFLLAGLLTIGTLAAQGLHLPLGNPAYELLDRLTIKYGFTELGRPAFNPGLRPVNRADLVRLFKAYDARYGSALSATDRFWLQQAYDDNNAWLALPPTDSLADRENTAANWLNDDLALASTTHPDYRNRSPRLGLFYRSPAHLLEVNRPNFFLRFNPILDLRYGKMRDETEDYVYNRRGAELRGGVDDRLFFYFQILETQRSLPTHLRRFRQRFEALPGAGFVKEYSGLGIREEGVDFLNSQGYVSYELSPHVGMRLGYGDHFIGRGERSLLLSDFSYNYPFLQFNWRIWKFHYQNTFAQLTAGPLQRTAPNRPASKKYMATHHLSINLGKRLNVGIFETVVHSRDDGFELAYLNPVIFYRAVEGGLGSPDNVLLGTDGSYLLPFGAELYWQFVLDEFKFDELIQNNRGWWANKWGIQTGLKVVDALGIDQLDGRVEYNRARPFLYTHNRGENSYSHYNIPLAHPLGANFSDLLLELRYRPLPRLQLTGRLVFISQGEDDPENERIFGENINVPSNDRFREYGNEIGQGIGYQNRILVGEASYLLANNLFLEGVYYRSRRTYADPGQADGFPDSEYLHLGLRWNVARRRNHF